MTEEELRTALAEPSQSSRKALAKVAEDMENHEPERYKQILSHCHWAGEALTAYRAYKTAHILSRVAMVPAVLAVVGGYIAGDFGMQLLEGWMSRYALAAGVLVALALLAGGGLLLHHRKNRLIAYGILEGL